MTTTQTLGIILGIIIVATLAIGYTHDAIKRARRNRTIRRNRAAAERARSMAAHPAGSRL